MWDALLTGLDYARLRSSSDDDRRRLDARSSNNPIEHDLLPMRDLASIAPAERSCGSEVTFSKRQTLTQLARLDAADTFTPRALP